MKPADSAGFYCSGLEKDYHLSSEETVSFLRP